MKITKMTGILLAGGKSSRMGKNKAFLEYNGKPLIAWNLERLQAIFPEVLVSSNEPELYRPFGVKVVCDQFVNSGPLGGLHACLHEAAFDPCFFVACDLPFINRDLVHYMASLTTDYDIVVPETKSGLHPLFAFYKRTCLPAIEENLKARRFKIIDFYARCSVRTVKEKELQEFGDPEWLLLNINTPQEWADFLVKTKQG